MHWFSSIPAYGAFTTLTFSTTQFTPELILIPLFETPEPNLAVLSVKFLSIRLSSNPILLVVLKISNFPLSEQKNILEETYKNWKGDLEQVDDVCIVGVRV